MIKIGELNRRIEVLEFIENRDSFGAVVGEWITTGRVWSKVEPLSGGESFTDQQIKATNKVRFVMRFYAAMCNDKRIKYMNKIYEVISVKDITDGHRFTEVEGKEINGDLLS